MLIVVPDMCRSPSWIQKSLGRAAFAAHCLMHPIELIFLARHVVGQIQPGPGVARCRWVPVASAPQTMPPPAAELIQHATTGTARATIGHQPLDTVARLRVAR